MNDVAPQPGNPSRRTVLVGAAWSVPVIAAAAAAPQVAASGNLFTLSNSNLEAKPSGLNVHVGLNQPTNQPVVATVTVTLIPTAGGPSITNTVVITVPAYGYKDANVLFSGLTIGTEYSGYITVTATGFQSIVSAPTNPASKVVDQYG